MSLTPEDLRAIDEIVKKRIEPIENDVKEIYNILVKNGITVV
jgi:hypothetical protein